MVWVNFSSLQVMLKYRTYLKTKIQIGPQHRFEGLLKIRNEEGQKCTCLFPKTIVSLME